MTDEFTVPGLPPYVIAVTDKHIARWNRIDHLWKQIRGLEAAIKEKEQEIKEYQVEIKRLIAELKQIEDAPWDSVG